MRRVLLSIMLCMSCLCIPALSASSFSVQELPFRINFTSLVSYDSGAIANNAKATAELVISKAPIYQNIWFKTSVLIISIGLIFLIPLIRDRRAFNGLQWIKAIFNKRTAALNSEVKQESYNRASPVEVAALDQNEHTIKLGSLSEKIAPKNPITELSSESYSVKELIHELISIFEDNAKSKGVAVEYWILPDVPAVVLGDRKCVLHLLSSLVANAIRYTKEGGVSIFAEALSEQGGDCELWFTVSDTGTGISDELQEQMFDQFSQNDNSVLFKDAHELGLGECKELIVKMGGDFWAESKEGKGSVFKFNIKSSIPQATVSS
jgi:hypothetical protein